jgi:hypothetical protein
MPALPYSPKNSRVGNVKIKYNTLCCDLIVVADDDESARAQAELLCTRSHRSVEM